MPATEDILKQLEQLPIDLPRLHTIMVPAAREVLSQGHRRPFQQVLLTGCGDSYHAACATEMAFESFSGIRCTAVSALPFTKYKDQSVNPGTAATTLVIGISASGRTKQVMEAIDRANNVGAVTLGITSTPQSPITAVAQECIVLELPDLKPSPGIRTYQASLLALILLAIQIGETQSLLSFSDTQMLRAEVEAAAGAIQATLSSLQDLYEDVADLTANAPVRSVLGSGPSYGTALFSSAKIVETAGAFTFGQDIEEWWHVERFSYPSDMPIFVVAPPGRSYASATECARRAQELGRNVIAVINRGDSGIAAHATHVLPTIGSVREEFSPLLYHLFAGYIAAAIARARNREPFKAGKPAQ